MIGGQWCSMRVLRTHEGRMFSVGSAKLVCRLEPESYNSHCTQTLRVRRQLCREKELAVALVTCRRGCCGHRNAAKHLRGVKVVTESNPADIKKYKTVAVETMERNDKTIKNLSQRENGHSQITGSSQMASEPCRA